MYFNDVRSLASKTQHLLFIIFILNFDVSYFLNVSVQFGNSELANIYERDYGLTII